MYSNVCEGCRYQSYGYLERNDTVCPFYYDFKECFKLTEGKFDEIVKYDVFVEENGGLIEI